VFWVDLGHGEKPWLIVSNDARNRNLETCLAARITTTTKHADHPTVVPLPPGEPLAGNVVVDDIVQLDGDELGNSSGALSLATMRAVSRALRIALP
jgi:mRNA interferase MazF